MENRHLFRGKRQDNKKWVIGNRIDSPDGRVAITETGGEWELYECNPETVCQCVGYEGIFERDIFLHDDDLYIIRWCDADLRWWAEAVFSRESDPLGEFRPEDIEVIGNEIDNPALLEA